jgi:hypothetical protein
MRRPLVTLLCGLALCALSACGKKEEKAAKGSSFGEVLPGSASDAMLPYDTVTSAPPLENPGANLDDAGPAARESGSADEDEAAEPDDAPEPAAT